MPPAALVAVLAIAIGGRLAAVPDDAARGVTTAEALPAAPLATPFAPARTRTTEWRSDWPAAIRGTASLARLGREEGTDGLMGRLPFGLPNDTPLVRAERHDRFVTDDVRPPST
ncbi:MAG TPA: hypothetical protein VGO64_04595 [Candidatus Limnocylindrales bacterium]|nr:hypothetical protein [Candidatus Limnocylindrales bacterium]